MLFSEVVGYCDSWGHGTVGVWGLTGVGGCGRVIFLPSLWVMC